MKIYLLLATIAVTLMPTMQQSCPQDPLVGNPINYFHLFKEQTDLDWDFYNTKTTYQLILQEITNLPANVERHKIVFKVTNSNLPVRSWFYMIDIRYDANKFIFQIDKQARIRTFDVAATDLNLIKKFFDDNAIVLAAPGNCCLAKLEYINFYYLFANYYKDGLGITQPACTN